MLTIKWPASKKVSTSTQWETSQMPKQHVVELLFYSPFCSSFFISRTIYCSIDVYHWIKIKASVNDYGDLTCFQFLSPWGHQHWLSVHQNCLKMDHTSDISFTNDHQHDDRHRSSLWPIIISCVSWDKGRGNGGKLFVLYSNMASERHKIIILSF